MIAKGVASVLISNQIDDVIIRRGRAKESGYCARALRFSRGMLSNDPVASYCRALPCSLSHTPDVPSPFVVHVFFHFLSRLNNRGYASWRSCTYPWPASVYTCIISRCLLWSVVLGYHSRGDYIFISKWNIYGYA